MLQHRVINPGLRTATFGGLACAFAIAFALFGGGSSARAEAGRAKAKSPARSCQAALQSAQEKAQAGSLVEASHLFTSCSDESCGTSIWHDCVAKNTQLRATIPSVIPIVLGENDEPRVDVEVKMDGRVIASQINGRAIAVDPGPHEFSFSVGSEVFASAKVTITEGERNRTLAVASPSATGSPRLATTAAK